MNSKTIKKKALIYLKYRDQEIDPALDALIEDCIQEAVDASSFRAMSVILPLKHDPLSIDQISVALPYPSLEKLFQDCDRIMIVACTLGQEMDRKLRYYGKFDMTRLTILDSVCNAYLEEACDDYEKERIHEKRTFRYAPGYGDVPIALNEVFMQYLNTAKNIGLTVQETGMLLPQKSMVGMIGIGERKTKKTCNRCLMENDCEYRKKGLTCYTQD